MGALPIAQNVRKFKTGLTDHSSEFSHRLDPKLTLSHVVGRDGRGVWKIGMSPLSRLPAVSCTKLRGRHEGVEAGLHGFIAPFA
jgi:hypothetical protein